MKSAIYKHPWLPRDIYIVFVNRSRRLFYVSKNKSYVQGFSFHGPLHYLFVDFLSIASKAKKSCIKKKVKQKRWPLLSLFFPRSFFFNFLNPDLMILLSQSFSESEILGNRTRGYYIPNSLHATRDRYFVVIGDILYYY